MFNNFFKIFVSTFGLLFWSANAHGQYVPLNTWFNLERGDHFTTTLPSWRGNIGERKAPGYLLIRHEGSLLSPDYPQPADTLPVYSFYSDVRKDNFLSSNPVWTGRENRDGYRRVRLEGYIYKGPKANTVPLNSLWSTLRKDNYNTTDPRLALEIGTIVGNRTQTIGEAGYRIFRVEGYMLPPPVSSDIKQPAYIANLKKIGFGEWRPLKPSERGVRPDSVLKRGEARFKSRMVIVPMEFSDMRFSSGDLVRFGKFASATDDLSLERGVSAISRGKFTWQAKLTPVVRDQISSTQAGKLDEAWKVVNRITETVDGRDNVTWTAEMFERRNGYPISVYDLDGDGAKNDEVNLRTRTLKLTDRFIRFNTYDTNRNGRVEGDELTVLRFGAEPGNGGQMGRSDVYDGDGKMVVVPVGLVSKDTTRAGLIHELLHIWGGTDVYGPGFSMNFRNTIMSAMAGDDTVWELDPWHLQKFGWVLPRFVPIGPSARKAGGSEIMLAAGHDIGGQEDARPIIFYDPARGLREYFIAQYRSEFPQCPRSSLPRSACPNYQDNGAPDTGFAIWHVRTKATGGLEDMFKRDDGDDRVAWPDGTGDGGHLFFLGVINPEDGKVGATRYLKPSDSQLAPRWWNGDDTGLRFRAGFVSETSPVAVLQWRDVSTVFTPRLDILRHSGFPIEEYPVVNAGQTVAVDGIFGADRAGFGARIVSDSGDEILADMVSWSPTRLLIKIPLRATPGRYKLFVGASSASTGSFYMLSNGLKFKIPLTNMTNVDLPRGFDSRFSVPGLPQGLSERVDLTARSVSTVAQFPGAPIAPHSDKNLNVQAKNLLSRNTTSFINVPANFPANIAITNVKICSASVQGKIAWNYNSNKEWGSTNITRLCKGAETSAQPAICFQRAMHGRSDGERWKWNEAIDLCAGSKNANATIRCYDQQTRIGRSQGQAIKTCGK